MTYKKNCLFCKKIFYNRRSKAIYCTKNCYFLDYKLPPSNCKECGINIISKFRKKNTKFCSYSCKGKWFWKNKPELRTVHHAIRANWKGDKVGYIGVHLWMRKMYGTPNTCEHCLKNNFPSRKMQWANKNGKYKRIREDWIRLCAKCHYKFDEQNNLRKGLAIKNILKHKRV